MVCGYIKAVNVELDPKKCELFQKELIHLAHVSRVRRVSSEQMKLCSAVSANSLDTNRYEEFSKTLLL